MPGARLPVPDSHKAMRSSSAPMKPTVRRLPNSPTRPPTWQWAWNPWISGAPAPHHRMCVRGRLSPPDTTNPTSSTAVKRSTARPYWWVDSGAALQNLLLAVVDEGLSAGFLGVHTIPGLKALLGIPEEYTPIGIVTVGYGAADRKSGSLKRGWRKRQHVVHWGRWDPDWEPGFLASPRKLSAAGFHQSGIGTIRIMAAPHLSVREQHRAAGRRPSL